MDEEITYMFLGIAAGTLTGLIPGIHSNTIAAFAAGFFTNTNLPGSIFIVSMGMSHSVASAIPSIVLGAAQETTFHLLPGQEMLMHGKGVPAITITVLGCLIGIVFGTIMSAAIYLIAEKYSAVFPNIIPAVIFATTSIVIISQRKKSLATIICLSSAALGMITLNSGITEIVFALITGFFAMPSLLCSAISRAKIPRQEKHSEDSAHVWFGAIIAIFAGVLSIMPGLGPSNSAFLVNTLVKKLDKSEYLLLGGGIGATNLFFTIIMLYALGKTRSGIAIALENLAPKDLRSMAILAAAALAATGIAAIITLKAAPKMIEKFQKNDYGKISAAIFVLLAILVFCFSGIAGIAACTVACAIGHLCATNNVSRSLCMSFLLIPTMLFYLGISL